MKSRRKAALEFMPVLIHHRTRMTATACFASFQTELYRVVEACGLASEKITLVEGAAA
jgi:hypothetical protein